jgi:putative glutamine amidotransferase
MKRPIVLVVTRRTLRKNRPIDYIGEAHLALLVRLKILPVMIPVVDGTLRCLAQYAEGMSGLLLTEGDDVEPTRYHARKANFLHLEGTNPLKDEIEVRLARRAMRLHVPILGICRGSQLLNVVCGGTLYGDVQKEKKSDLKHIEHNMRRCDTYRHPITLVDGSPLQRWYRQATVKVNSYHHQGIRELAARFQPMAHAEDGLVEAFYDPKRDFTVGLQFHPERMLPEYSGNWRIWKAFGTAVHQAASAQ